MVFKLTQIYGQYNGAQVRCALDAFPANIKASVVKHEIGQDLTGEAAVAAIRLGKGKADKDANGHSLAAGVYSMILANLTS